jgi:hypothetical protein
MSGVTRPSLPDDLCVLLRDQEIVERGAALKASRSRDAAPGEEQVHDVTAVEIDADGLDGAGGGGHELAGEEVARFAACFSAEFGRVDVR